MEDGPLKVKGVHGTWNLYSHGVVANGFLFVSGQVALDQAGNLVGKGNIKAQTEQVMQNLGRILESAGASFSDIVKITVHLIDFADRRDFHEVRRKYFGQSLPASTLVMVKRLIDKEMLVEVEAIALVKK